MGVLLHLVQRGGAWAGCGSAQALLRVIFVLKIRVMSCHGLFLKLMQK